MSSETKFPVGVDKKTDWKRTKPYRARISINGKQRHLGMFASVEEASRAYQQARDDCEPAPALSNRRKVKRTGKAVCINLRQGPIIFQVVADYDTQRIKITSTGSIILNKDRIEYLIEKLREIV